VNPPHPPKKDRGFSTAGGRELGLGARPPARFISLSNTEKHITTNELKHESQTACLLRPLGCLLSMRQRDRLGRAIPNGQPHPNNRTGGILHDAATGTAALHR